MHYRIQDMLARIEHPDVPVDYAEYLALHTDFTEAPAPEITWTVLGLIRYLAWKKWAWRIVGERVGWHFGWQPRNAISQTERRVAVTARSPEWAVLAEGDEVRLVNQATGQEVEVPMNRGPGVVGVGGFFKFVYGSREPGPAERRLRELFPEGVGLSIAIKHLAGCHELRLLDPPDADPFKLAPWLSGYTRRVRDFLRAWDDADQRLALATLIGDWPVVQEEAQSQGMDSLTATATAEANRSRRRWINLLRVAWDDEPGSEVLQAMVHARAEELNEYLMDAFDSIMLRSTAIKIVRDDPTWLERVHKVFRETCEVPFETPGQAEAARYLARHGWDVEELIEGLLAKPADCSTAIRLALMYAPRNMRRLLRRGLRSRFSVDRLTAAAILALVDREWARRELAAHLERSRSQDRTIEARCALRESRDAAARAAADGWETQHPEKSPPPKNSARFSYAREGGCQHALRQLMAELNEAVRQVEDLMEDRVA